jgi:hypothetical protein
MAWELVLSLTSDVTVNLPDGVTKEELLAKFKEMVDSGEIQKKLKYLIDSFPNDIELVSAHLKSDDRQEYYF